MMFIQLIRDYKFDNLLKIISIILSHQNTYTHSSLVSYFLRFSLSSSSLVVSSLFVLNKWDKDARPYAQR